MNRYLWIAAGLAIPFLGCLAAIIFLNVSDPRVAAEINLALTAIATFSGVGGTVYGVLGTKEKQSTSQSAPSVVPITQGSVVRTRPLEVQNEADSRKVYVDQVLGQLDRLAGPSGAFISLSTAAETAHQVVRSQLMPNLEWMSRTHDQEYVQAIAEDVDLVAIPDKFERSVLLGEPGSGKSTCLHHLTQTLIDRLQQDEAAPIPLFVSLAEWRDRSLLAEDFLRERLESLVGSTNYYVDNFDRLLVAGRFVLLLDGLNEMPERKANDREGRHEQRNTDSMSPLQRPGLPRMDPRESSLRDLATRKAQRSRFVITCRSHEYADSLEWQVVRVLPMQPDQIDRFITAYEADPDRAEQLRQDIAGSPSLAAIASSPFFLRSIIEIYRPGIDFHSRGRILTYLLETLLAREAKRTGHPGLSASQIIKGLGPVSFRMLANGEIGAQAEIPLRDESAHAAADTLLDTGLLLDTDGAVLFRHQIIQEFFAAAALSQRVVKKRPANLLADKRWSEVVALWCDMNAKMADRVVRCFRARNYPWRTQSRYTNMPFVVYGGISSIIVVLIVAALLYDWLFGLPKTLPFIFGLVAAPPILVVAVGLIVIRLLWRNLFLYNSVIAVNSAYVLASIRHISALPKMIQLFARLFQRDRAELAQSLALMHLTAPRQVKAQIQAGLTDRHWRVRAGCVQTLGELIRQDPSESEATETLLRLCDAGDPQLFRPLSEALVHSQDPRTPDAIAVLTEQVGRGNALASAFRLEPLTNGRIPGKTGPTYEQVSERFKASARKGQPAPLRMLSVKVMGVLRLEGCEEILADIARDRTEDPNLRNAAVAGLGFAETPAAVEWLANIGQANPELRDAVRTAFAGIRDQSALPGLITASESSSAFVRGASALPLGALQSDQALSPLSKLAADADPDVRTAAARGLAAIGRPVAVPILERLARDPLGNVRDVALQSLEQRYAGAATPVLLSMAEDNRYPERTRVIRMLGHHVGEDVTSRLTMLTGDPVQSVRDAAAGTLAHLRRTEREDGAHARSAFLHPFAWFSEKLDFEGLKDMWEEEELSGMPKGEIMNRLPIRISSDAELTRRFRLALRLYYGLWTVIFMGLSIVCSFVTLALLALAELLLSVWLYPVGVLAASIIIAAIRLTGRRSLRRLVPGWLGFAAYASAGLLLTIAIVGGIVYVWWIFFAICALALTGLAVRIVRKRSLRARDVAAALQRPLTPPVAVTPSVAVGQ